MQSLMVWLMMPTLMLAQTDSTSRSVVLKEPIPVSEDQQVVIGSSSETNIHPVRFGIVTGTVAATIAGIHIYQTNGWWQGNRTAFHFQEDLVYGRTVDKLGHFYSGIAAAFILRKSYAWAGLSEEAALYWGSGGSLLFQTYIEIEDGFSAWGFDRVDFAADVAGAAWPILQHHSPFMRNFDFKFGYWPSSVLDSGGGVGFEGQKHIVFDDYQGQTIWLSMNMKNLLPKGVDEYWPSFFRLGIGYAARDVTGPDPARGIGKPYSVLVIGLDYDMTKIIPDNTPFLKLLGEALNFIKFPAPAVQITPHAIWYGLYF